MRFNISKPKLILLLPLLFALLGSGFLAGCRKKAPADGFSFSLTPKDLTVLNDTAWTCADKSTGATAATGTAGVASFKSMVINWKNPDRAITIYAMRITGTDTTGAKIDMTLGSADFWSLVRGLVDTTKDCSFCQIGKTVTCTNTITTKCVAADQPWVQTITDNVAFTDYLGTVTTGISCGPIIYGLTVPKDLTHDVTVYMKATLLAYSTDDTGNINNEYASFPFTLKFQGPPP